MSELRRDGGEHIAPVIPLFGGGPPRTAPEHDRDEQPAPSRPGGHAESPVAPAGADAFRDAATSADTDASAATGDESASGEAWHTTWRELGRERGRLAPAPELSTVRRDGVRFIELAERGDDDAAETPDLAELAARAERKLLRSLGSRGLSVSEARTKLRLQEVPAELADEIIDRLLRTGALDDARLAEQLVHAATARKKQGRRAIGQSLAARGIARDVVDAALAELPDDDADRALEFARSKAGQLARFDEDTALRRLVGQLARRGFGGSLAMSAARRALDEARGPAGRVRFE